MKRLMIGCLAIIALSCFSCKSYCGKSCVNRYSSVTPKEDKTATDTNDISETETFFNQNTY
ncbi:hypothetical protein [Neptunitalea lumnitzerae]|uniref:hypothetical protein n=1 Tax=Neptunitalea lumnitzerae TaxID=2965509 RepID=UPI002493C61C|nr:hypothetical protein [Neptunitalea sp. Y10]